MSTVRAARRDPPCPAPVPVDPMRPRARRAGTHRGGEDRRGGVAMSDVDYEDLTTMRLDDDELTDLVSSGGECVFNWTTRDGYPVGVVVAYIYRDGRFWTTCAERRKRVPALRQRPQSAI